VQCRGYELPLAEVRFLQVRMVFPKKDFTSIWSGNARRIHLLVALSEVLDNQTDCHLIAFQYRSDIHPIATVRHGMYKAWEPANIEAWMHS
jgi:hypothetical protein